MGDKAPLDHLQGKKIGVETSEMTRSREKRHDATMERSHERNLKGGVYGTEEDRGHPADSM